MQIANAGGIYRGLIADPIKRMTFGPLPLEYLLEIKTSVKCDEIILVH